MSRVTPWVLVLASLALAGLIAPLAQAADPMKPIPGLSRLPSAALVSLNLPVTRDDQVKALSNGSKPLQAALAKLHFGPASPTAQPLPEDEVWHNGIVLTPLALGYNWPPVGNTVGCVDLETKHACYGVSHVMPQPDDNPPLLDLYTEASDGELFVTTFRALETAAYLLTFSICATTQAPGVQPPIAEYTCQGGDATSALKPMLLSGDNTKPKKATHWTGVMTAEAGQVVTMKLRWPTSIAASWAKLTIRMY